MTKERRAWLWVALSFFTFVALIIAQADGLFARKVTLGAPYLDHCTPAGGSYRCGGDRTSLKVVNLPIRLKLRRDYTIIIHGRSLAPEIAVLYVDFFGENYDAAEQKGLITLQPGAPRAHVLRWSSDLPPANALLRLSNREATDYEITSIEVRLGSKWLPRLRTLALLIGLVLLVERLWNALPAIRRRLSGAEFLRRETLLPPLLLALSVAVVLLVRVATMNVPMVFGDEMSYALLSSSLGDVTVYWRNHVVLPLPNQIYFDVYHLATLCGEATLACARAMNCLFFALSAFPLYALARRVLPRNQAVATTAIVLLLPNNAYTSLFMPEAFYFFCFCLAAWSFLSFLSPTGRAVDAAGSALTLVVLSLVKPHGLTILLACNLTLLFGVFAWREDRARLARGWALMLLLFFVARGMFAVFAGSPGDGPLFERMFGLYANLLGNALQSVPDAAALQRLKLATFDNVGSLLLIAGLPLAVSATWLARGRAHDAVQTDRVLDRWHVFVWITLVCLIYGTIKFTAYIAGVDPSQNPARIHERYYDFMFSVLAIAAAGSWHAMRWSERRVRVAARIFAASAAAVSIWYLLSGFGDLRAEWVDHPILYSLHSIRIGEIAWLALLLILAMLLLPGYPRVAAGAGAIAYTLLATLGLVQIWKQQAGSQTFWDADRAALALEVLYTPEEREHGLIIGDDLGLLYRTSFYLRTNINVWKVPEGSTIDVANLAPGSRWVLTFGDYKLEGDWQQRLALPARATLYSVRDGGAASVQ